MGSMQSGDDMVAGEPNLAQDSTWILAQERMHFGGGMVFIVGAIDRTIRSTPFRPPSTKLHAIVGLGTNRGVGVIGLDAANQDHDISEMERVGVYGNGDRAGVMGESLRGSGVEGVGGLSRRGNRAIATAGVVGRGGRQLDENAAPHGPGVYGIGGGRYELHEDDLRIASNIGVFGQGAGEHFGNDGVETDRESLSPGVGVAGRGGISSSGSVAPGVVGISGRRTPLEYPVPPTDGVIGRSAGDVGVYGRGATGVLGFGLDGIKGYGTEGRGGIFESDESAQLQLVPREVPGARTQAPFAPSAITNAGRLLPETGLPGDLMAIADEKGECTLWFCVSNKKVRSRPRAHWAQVLLGPVAVGRA